MSPFSLNIHGKLYDYTHPAVMGIINITPDSLYSGSQTQDKTLISERVSAMIAEGVDIIDIGGYSTRPGHQNVTADEELRRIERGLQTIREIAPEIPVSVDTFRADVANRAVSQLGADIINDISCATADSQMIDTVARLHVPYILTHSQGTIDDMHQRTQYSDVTADVIRALADKVVQLQLAGVNDIIIDPGFGFSKTTEQNYELLHNLDALQCLHKPILVGLSRKSMINKPLHITAEESMNGTTVLNTIALLKGAAILRVHDVQSAKQAISLVSLYETKGTANLNDK